MILLNSVLKTKKDLLSVYFTAGFPNLDDTSEIISTLEEAGADIIEVGLPYSDPLADGPTIQNSSSIALANGINLDAIFQQLKAIKGHTQIPLVLMGYLNQLLVYGVERFLSSCKDAGIQALIIPDLPMDEYKSSFMKRFHHYELSNIFLVTPQTSVERIRMIDDLSECFIYLVSSAAITGSKSEISDEQKKYFKRIQEMNLKNPTLIGFGISDRQSFKTACEYSSGAIIGSAFIKAVSEKGNLKPKIKFFIQSIKH